MAFGGFLRLAVLNFQSLNFAVLDFAAGLPARSAASVTRAAADAAFLPFAENGAIAQLGERVLCKHEVVGSIPSGSTKGLAAPGWVWPG